MKRRSKMTAEAIKALLGLAVWLPAPLLAADADPAATPQTQTGVPLASVLASSGIAVTGYVAASYYHSSGDNTFHEFDTNHDTFQLDQAGLQVGYQPKEGFGAFTDVLVGEDARTLNTAENATNSTFNARQAYVQYATGAWTLIGGKFTTLAGEEYSNPTSDSNFSRSLLFFAQPLTHTGVRATWAASGALNLVAGINNGWNTTSTSYGSKTAELGAAFTPTKELALNLQGYFGKVPGYDAERSFVDFVASYNLTDALSFALNYDWGVQQQHVGPDLRWNGLAAYVNYAFDARWRVSARGEYLDDQDGFNTGTAQKLKEGTLTVGFAPAKNFELRAEVRYDWSDQQTLVRTLPGILPAAFGDNQTELALQGVYKF